MEEEKKERIYKSLMLILITVIITFILTSMMVYKAMTKDGFKYVTTADGQTIGLDATLASFRKVLEKEYLGEIDDNELIEGAIKGYIAGLNDPYTEYYTKEEMKMINETRKILGHPNLPITATTVRVPVQNCHGESINVELEKDFSINEIISILKNSPGIIVEDEPNKNLYPMSSTSVGHDEVFVGRIRKDFSVKHGINMWVVADNLRKGAASNAIQIMERMIEQ